MSEPTTTNQLTNQPNKQINKQTNKKTNKQTNNKNRNNNNNKTNGQPPVAAVPSTAVHASGSKIPTGSLTALHTRCQRPRGLQGRMMGDPRVENSVCRTSTAFGWSRPAEPHPVQKILWSTYLRAGRRPGPPKVGSWAGGGERSGWVEQDGLRHCWPQADPVQEHVPQGWFAERFHQEHVRASHFCLVWCLIGDRRSVAMFCRLDGVPR